MDPVAAALLYGQGSTSFKPSDQPSLSEQVLRSKLRPICFLAKSLRDMSPSAAFALTKPCVLQLGSSEEFLQHFGLRLAQLLAPGAPIQNVQQAIRQTIAEATILSNNSSAIKSPANQERQMELVYVHDCRYSSHPSAVTPTS